MGNYDTVYNITFDRNASTGKDVASFIPWKTFLSVVQTFLYVRLVEKHGVMQGT